MAQGSVKRPPNSRSESYNPVPAQHPAPRSTLPAQPPHPGPRPETLAAKVSAVMIPGWAILPLRLFLGVSFLAAGFDKLTDPTYLDPSAPSYIGQQITQFAPGTPLEGFLLNIAVPNAALFGVMVMGGELCIGIAVLLGILTRFSAAMGLLLNLTFFLSATWTVHPFYFGADLPYVAGWLTLLLAGAGPFAIDPLLKQWLSPRPFTYASKGRMVTVEDSGTAMTRRAFLGASAAGLTGVALAATGLGWSILNSGKRKAAVSGGSPTPAPTQAPTAAPTQVAVAPPTTSPATAPTTAPTTAPQNPQPSGQGGGTQAQAQPTTPPAQSTPNTAPAVSGLQKIAGPNDVPANQSLDFTLPSGDPAVLVHTDAGYSAYVAICTHEGCQVSYFPQYKIIGCPCHGAEFDAANNGQVLRGPARRPLSAVQLKIGPDGSVYVAG